jgi:hypothetical protein
MKIASWVGSLAATLVVSLPFTVTGGCADTRVDVGAAGTIAVPFVPDIDYDFRMTAGGETEVVGDGGPSHAKRCFLMTVYGDGSVILEQFVIEADSHGSFSQQLPKGAKSISAAAIDCDEAAEILKKQGTPPVPEAEEDAREEEEEDEDEVDAPAGPQVEDSVFGNVHAAAGVSMSSTYVFHGATVVPDFALGGRNIRFAASVTARDVHEALTLLQPVVERGIGSGVSPLVNVHLYTHVSLDLMGVRIRAASTTQIEELILDVNHGAHSADLGARREVVQSNVNAWSVVESTMPLTDVIVSPLPWEQYSNHGTLDVRLAGMHEFVHAELTTTAVPRR